MVDRSQDADGIDGRHPRCLLHDFDACLDGMLGIKQPSSQRSGHVFHPPFAVVDPAAGLEDVPEDKDKGDDPGPALERVAEISRIGIVGQVALSPRDDNRADDAVEQDRQKDAGPLGHFQGSLTGTVDHIDALLVAVVEDPHVGQDMDRQEGPDGDQAGQRVQAADEEFMPAENRSNVSHFRLEAPWITRSRVGRRAPSAAWSSRPTKLMRSWVFMARPSRVLFFANEASGASPGIIITKIPERICACNSGHTNRMRSHLQCIGTGLEEFSEPITRDHFPLPCVMTGPGGESATYSIEKIECGKQDLNLHDLAATRPSTWRVCQFRHSRRSSVLFSLSPANGASR